MEDPGQRLHTVGTGCVFVVLPRLDGVGRYANAASEFCLGKARVLARYPQTGSKGLGYAFDTAHCGDFIHLLSPVAERAYRGNGVYGPTERHPKV
jgi:hypothetical protein